MSKARMIEALRLEHVDLAIIDDLGWEAGPIVEEIEIAELFGERDFLVRVADHPLRLSTRSPGRTWPITTCSVTRATRSGRGSSLGSAGEPGSSRGSTFACTDGAAALAFTEAGITIAILPRLAVFETASEAIRWRTLHPVVHRVLLAATRDSRAGSGCSCAYRRAARGERLRAGRATGSPVRSPPTIAMMCLRMAGLAGAHVGSTTPSRTSALGYLAALMLSASDVYARSAAMRPILRQSSAWYRLLTWGLTSVSTTRTFIGLVRVDAADTIRPR